MWNDNSIFIRKLSWVFSELLENFRRFIRKFFNKFGNIFNVLLFYFTVSKSLAIEERSKSIRTARKCEVSLYVCLYVWLTTVWILDTCPNTFAYCFYNRCRLTLTSRGAATRTPEMFRNFSKDFLRKYQKMHYFRIFFKKISQTKWLFFGIWTKNTLLKNFWKFSKDFVRKLWKSIILTCFKKFNNQRVNFSRVWTKNSNC